MHSKSLISAEIAAFYEDIIGENSRNGVERFFDTNLTLKFKEIYTFLLSALNVKNKNQMDFKNLEYEDFLRVCKKINPIFQQSKVILKNANIEQLNFDLLRNKNLMLATFKSAPTKLYERGTENVEKILLLTSLLEFALGSIFHAISGSRTPPHLLKDLLCTKELEMFFGLEALTFLKIIIGTPKAINLRNIVWHGFPKPEAVPSYYVSILLLVIHSLGHILQAKEFKLIFRRQITDFSTYLATICSTCNMPTNFAIDENIFRAILDHCQLIPQDYKPYWQQLYFYLQTAQYWRFVLLILPQLELILRLLYAKLNDFDISAKLHEYYITLDTIFEPTVPNSSNQPNCIFSETCDLSIGALHFMYDIFLAPKGPRLRDKISHGEVSMEAINNQELCQTLLYLAFNLITRNERDYPLAKYESQFHTNSFAKASLNKASKTCNEFKQTFEIKYDKGLSLDFIESYINIFQRPKKESFYMHLIAKIANSLSYTCRNFEESIKLRQSLLAHHELHSKRRRTLENLMKTLPTFCCFLELALDCLSNIYIQLQASTQDFKADDAVCLQRFLKHTLKIAENSVKYSDKDSNKWIKIGELSKDFDGLYKRLYLKFRDNDLS